MNFHIDNRGFSIVEVILAVALFAVFAVGGTVALVSGLDANRLALEQVTATQYAQEGIEAMRSIKNQAFSSLADTSSTTTGIARIGNVWAYSGLNNTFDSGRYERTITVSQADPNVKKVTAKVSWDFTAARPLDVTLTSYLTNWKAPIAGGGPIMMVYSKTTGTPFYRIWNGSSWSAESSAQNVGSNINYVVLKSARTRNEAILGTSSANGNIYAQVWNGTSWGTPTLMGTGLAAYRGFDIEYEKSSDRAVFVYLPTATSVDPVYRIWDGSSWSSATPITPSPPTTGIVRWIELAQNPGSTSNDIAVMMLDANVDVYGMVWNGSSWGNMGVSAIWDSTASTADRKAIDVAYEQTSGRAMFIWGDATSTDQYYRIWDGTALTANTLLDIPASGGVANWVKLVSRPSSNELLYGVQDAHSSPDLNTRKWSGSSWDTVTEHPEHSAGTENLTSMNFDLVWETHSANPGKAWLMWGNGTRVSAKQWSGTAWGATNTNVTGTSDDTSFIRLKADPISGAIFSGIYEDASAGTANRDIWESRLTSGSASWTAKNTIWGGPTGATPVFFRVDIATP